MDTDLLIVNYKMFSTYTILFALLALGATQGTSAQHIKSINERSLSDLVSKGKEAIERLRNIAYNGFEAAKKELLVIKNVILGVADIVLSNAQAFLKEDIEKVKQHIEHLKKVAAEIGVGVKECVIENQSELQQIPKSIIGKLVTCVTNEGNKAKEFIEGAIADIKDIKDKLSSLPSDLNVCLTSLGPVECVQQLLADVISAVTTVPSDIQNRVNQIVELVNNLESNLKACALGKVLEASKEAAVVGAKIAKCVADKIRGKILTLL